MSTTIYVLVENMADDYGDRSWRLDSYYTSWQDALDVRKRKNVPDSWEIVAVDEGASVYS